MQGRFEGLKLLYVNGFEGTSTDFVKMNAGFDWMEQNLDYIILCPKVENEIVGTLMGVANREIIGECGPYGYRKCCCFGPV